MNTTFELIGVALAALLSENLVLVSCMGIGTHLESFQNPREAIRTGGCLTAVMVLGVLLAWTIDFFLLALPAEIPKQTAAAGQCPAQMSGKSHTAV